MATKERDPSLFVDEDLPEVSVEGAQFFGGNREKEEFYDPLAEAAAGEDLELAEHSFYDRFGDRQAFADDLTADVARDVQSQINAILHDKAKKQDDRGMKFTYAFNVQWESPFQKPSAKPGGPTGTPSPVVQALVQAKEFYRSIHVAVKGGRRKDIDQVELDWEISVVWPTVWEPRILLTGRSVLSLDPSTSDGSDSYTITRQVDELDTGTGSLVSTVADQIGPRFWDVYHIGMTPSSEVSPKLLPSQKVNKGLFSNYRLYDLPARLYLQPSVVDLGSRADNNAGTIPNHAFTCAIKTMGPAKDVYTPTSPVQVNLVQQKIPIDDGKGSSSRLVLQWLIPLSVQFIAANAELPLPGQDDGELSPQQGTAPDCKYVWQGPRRVATLTYGGSPQDSDISAVRQRLYEQVLRDGHKVKLGANTGRPVFFFWQNGVKACFTSTGGLGMAVYEWRPKFVETNEVGIELEL